MRNALTVAAQRLQARPVELLVVGSPDRTNV